MSEINAIATNNYILHNIDAKKLYVQEPLFTANSGDAVYVGWRPDETVLWSGTAQSNIQLNEPITNFDRIGILFGRASNSEIKFFDTSRSAEGLPLQFGASFSNGYASTYTQTWVFSNSTTLTTGQKAKEWWGKDGVVSSRDTTDMPVYKVIGINRKEKA